MASEKLLVMAFTRSFGQVNFTTNETRDDLVKKLLGDRAGKMCYVVGVDDSGWNVEQWFELERPGYNDSSAEIGLLVIRKPPSGKIMVPRPPQIGPN
jgi:hypothetical protein